MPQEQIDKLIINSPYEEPQQYWRYDPESKGFERLNGRRPAGYLSLPKRAKFDDPGDFVPIPLVAEIRQQVKKWREGGYPGVSGITSRLLKHWRDEQEFDQRRFFFCQLEAAETLIWLSEGPRGDRAKITLPSDGSEFTRQCAKMATGSGKTIVMAMVAAWHILNKITYPEDERFSKNILVVAPGLTVKNRLAVLDPADDANYYEAFRIVPNDLRATLRQGRVVVRNWHALNWERAEKIRKKRGVDKRGVLSDEAYVRQALGEIAAEHDLLVINDEAHHAWRVNEASSAGASKDEREQATIWLGGLDRIHKTLGIINCYDFSATPFAASGKKSGADGVFEWIVSDFGLNDAIESGLVKTPRVATQDNTLPNSENFKSRLYHIYEEVKKDLNRKAAKDEPLPDLVLQAYNLLGSDWHSSYQAWRDNGSSTPPVMITVANRTETAARIKYAFDQKKMRLMATANVCDELCNPETTLHIDSQTLADLAKAEKSTATNQEAEQQLREQVNTVGQAGKPGAKIRNVISVGMLSEGWDAKTVTHIMGLRAFTSQLLCEQVVGRGLRRASYDVNPKTGLFEAEYVNIFGVPFTFLPHEGDQRAQTQPKPKTTIKPLEEKEQYKITWPNVVRIERCLRAKLSLDSSQVSPISLNEKDMIQNVDLAPIVDSVPNEELSKEIALAKLNKERMQTTIFRAMHNLYEELKPDDASWTESKTRLAAQLVTLVEQFINSDKIVIKPAEAGRDETQRNNIIRLNLKKLALHIKSAIQQKNTETLKLVFNQDQPLLSTADMSVWYTQKPCAKTRRSHINLCVYDSTWEATEAYILDRSDKVAAWVKNDHLGFELPYSDNNGRPHKYRPDFLVQLQSGTMLVLEVKGREREKDLLKHRALQNWVAAVNEDGRFGRWECAVSKAPGDVRDILAQHMQANGGQSAG